MRTLLIDNYDSFTFNLYQLLAMVNGEPPIVVRNDEIEMADLRRLDYDNVVLSPGPGTPTRRADFGLCSDLFAVEERPILGVCLGHQGLWVSEGGRVAQARVPMHGRASSIEHDGSGIFRGLPSPFRAVRYHSLIAYPPVPPGLRVTAVTGNHDIMAIEHRTRPRWGVQFHPESILSEHGMALMENFRDLTPARPRPRRIPPARPVAVPKDCTHRLLFRAAAHYRDPAQIFPALYARSSDAFWLDANRPDGAGFSYMGDMNAPGAALYRYSRTTSITIERSEGAERHYREPILDVIRRGIAGVSLASEKAPFPFKGGYLGYLGYELTGPAGYRARHVSAHPDAQLIAPTRFLVFDHQARLLYVAGIEPIGTPAEPDWMAEMLAALDALGHRDETVPVAQPVDAPLVGIWRHPKAAYLDRVADCLAQIKAGETYEICLTNHLELPPLDDPLACYRVLRQITQAPHSAYLRFGELAILSASPESFLKIDASGAVETKPIKGTRKRGISAPEDALLRDELATDEKDRSENLMIADLLRNDLGQVCAVGSVAVPSLMAVETFETVHHLVTTVTGQLAPGCDAIDCVRATFPGGSMTGAPKRRTMELIDRLEGAARGIYSGAIGYFGLDGAAEFGMVIRTIVATADSCGIGTGGAIVALSEPIREFEEIELKAAALIDAISIALAK